jgi:ATP-dependent RNA helicase RhlE
MTFADLNLNKPLLNALNELGYTTPTPIQEQVFPVVMSGRDVCGIAQTGTGKTLAYLLPCLRQYQFSKEHTTQILILVPTRELVVQVVDTIKQLTNYMNLMIVGVYGGVNLRPQQAEVQQGADILVATPGRLVDLLVSKTIKLKALKKLVIDEVDEMLTLGFQAQLTTIFDLLPKRQNLLFSATLTDDVNKLLDTYFANPVRIEAAPSGSTAATITQKVYEVPNFYTKVNLLDLLLRRHADMSRVLVFADSKAMTDLVHDQLAPRFPDQIDFIHANKAQNKRFDAVERFRSGEIRVLITTDLLARGLDIDDITHVVNFDLPDEPESYVHRVGRTGRANRSGVAISFITPADAELRTAIETLINQPIATVDLPDNLVVSEELLYGEKPQIRMKIIDTTTPRPDTAGSAFQEKIAKNQKVNVRRDIAAEKRLKYGRPIKRSGKK